MRFVITAPCLCALLLDWIIGNLSYNPFLNQTISELQDLFRFRIKNEFRFYYFFIWDKMTRVFLKQGNNDAEHGTALKT